MEPLPQGTPLAVIGMGLRAASGRASFEFPSHAPTLLCELLARHRAAALTHEASVSQKAAGRVLLARQQQGKQSTAET